MKLSQLMQALSQASSIVQGEDPDVVLCFEPATMEEGFSWESTEGISDVRVAPQWPLPGKSLIVTEHEKPSKVIIFYDNHFNLDSSKQ
jgi:Pyruvate/2-oxoacid:ferredoxin oxidoreductase gamma subunit